MKRLFIATKIELRQEYFDMVEKLKQRTTFDTITWTKPEVQHLTIRFLGPTPDSQIPRIVNLLRNISENTSPFTLNINKLGAFGSRYAPKVLWLGFDNEVELHSLYQNLEDGLLNLQVPPNYGNFVPHLTLARIKQVENKRKFWELIESCRPIPHQEILINEITLYRSRLESSGPIYTVLDSCKLSK